MPAALRTLLACAVLVGCAGAGASVGREPFASVVGAYRVGNGVVALFPQASGLRLVDYRTGALRALSERSPSLYVGGPGVSVPTPVRVRVRLEPGGRLRLDGREGRRIPLLARPAVFHDGAVRLVGRLLRPPGRERLPAVVIVPGSEPAHIDTYDLYAYFFAAHGFAVLTYDKRGVGGSGGTYVRAATTANLRVLAADAVAAVAWLRRQPTVDARRIGLSGGSQAGWVIELAASRSRAVRFAALQSGPAMSVGRQLAYARLTRQGALSPPPTERQIAARLAGAADSGFDPRPAISSLHIPVLWQLGAVDKRMYTPETVANLRAVSAAGRHDFTVEVYPGGAHSLRLTREGLIVQEMQSPGFVPGLFSDLAAWLRRADP
jgi:dienelactone hydrolase